MHLLQLFNSTFLKTSLEIYFESELECYLIVNTYYQYWSSIFMDWVIQSHLKTEFHWNNPRNTHNEIVSRVRCFQNMIYISRSNVISVRTKISFFLNCFLKFQDPGFHFDESINMHKVKLRLRKYQCYYIFEILEI